MNMISRFWTVLLLVAVSMSAAIAGDDTHYPAYDFQPQVVYRDPALTSASAAATVPASAPATDPKYPAAYFTPTIIHPAK